MINKVLTILFLLNTASFNFMNASRYSYKIFVDNIYQVDSHEMEFDIFIESGSGIQLNAYQMFFKISMDLSIYDQLVFQYLNGTTELKNVPVKTYARKQIDHSIIGLSSYASTETIISKKKIGRFKLICSQQFIFNKLNMEWYSQDRYNTIIVGANFNDITNNENNFIEKSNYQVSESVTIIHLTPGWNTISVPRIISEDKLKEIKGQISKGPYLINDNQSSQQPADSLNPKYAYWVNVKEDVILEFSGKPVTNFKYEVPNSGNYCMGSVANRINKEKIVTTPNRIIQGQMYFWDNLNKEYKTSNEVVPGRAHFFNVNQKGLLTVRQK